jgi:hypothetical protein
MLLYAVAISTWGTRRRVCSMISILRAPVRRVKYHRLPACSESPTSFAFFCPGDPGHPPSNKKRTNRCRRSIQAGSLCYFTPSRFRRGCEKVRLQNDFHTSRPVRRVKYHTLPACSERCPTRPMNRKQLAILPVSAAVVRFADRCRPSSFQPPPKCFGPALAKPDTCANSCVA